VRTAAAQRIAAARMTVRVRNGTDPDMRVASVAPSARRELKMSAFYGVSQDFSLRRGRAGMAT
jgi:hypothetical protein